MDVDYTTKSNLTELEAAVLTEYQNINSTLIKLNQGLKSLTNKDDLDGGESIRSVEALRQMETKLSLIYTFFKGAVYTLYADEGGDVEEEVYGDERGNTSEDENETTGLDGMDEDDKGTNELSSISNT
ncbi:DAD3 [Candida theae]|uniref:DASH complex subunit DAD3 n=1 Tax=Candida theae TaxID=1198502 RepID=A0AAD5FYX4_9ASCO|nr:DAD3 [Candida theae]KAI5958911.1 DAD3 [Candida theae]